MLLGAVLFLTGIWHESTVIAGLEIAPGPMVVAVVSPNVKRIVARFGARAVAVTGSALMAVAGAWWVLRLGAQPDFAGAFLPGMLIGGVGVGLTQATFYGVVAGVLPPHRFATGSGVLNMCRQISLALGVALVVAILGTAPGVTAFHRGFALMIGAGLVAALCSAWLPARVPVAATDGRPRREDRDTPSVEATAG
jgi:Major Facilitator Superfamily